MTEHARMIGIDLGDDCSHVCVLADDGSVTKRSRIETKPEAWDAFASATPEATIVIEAGSQSPWISQLLEDRGHDVIIANARQLGLIHGSRAKNDRVDAERLARVARVDSSLLAPIRHRREETRAHLAVLKARDTLVGTRTAWINHIRGTLKAFGVRPPRASAAAFHKRVEAHIPEPLEAALRPVLASLADISERIRAYDRRIARLAREDHPETALLTQVPGVGRVTALAYLLTLEDPARFPSSRRVGTYLGLTPRQDQSGSHDPQRGISKQGDVFVRKLLVQSAHYILGPFATDSDLRRHGLAIAARGGSNAKKRATTAIARKLAVLLHHLWITGEVYQPLREARHSLDAA